MLKLDVVKVDRNVNSAVNYGLCMMFDFFFFSSGSCILSFMGSDTVTSSFEFAVRVAEGVTKAALESPAVRPPV